MSIQKKQPLFNFVEPLDPCGISDGDMMFRGFILDHGLSVERYLRLSKNQKKYIETVICTLIRLFCDHLEKISIL